MMCRILRRLSRRLKALELLEEREGVYIWEELITEYSTRIHMGLVGVFRLDLRVSPTGARDEVNNIRLDTLYENTNNGYQITSS